MLEPGDAIALDGQEYLCFDQAKLDGKHYLYLITTSEPAEICFAEQTLIDDEPQVRIIGNQTEKNKLFSLLKSKAKSASAPREA